jgi:hypothetical protein
MGKLGAEKTVIVRLQGGLGNQLFQYAAARGLTEGRKLLLDCSALGSGAKNTPDTTTRFFELSVFSTLKYNMLPPIAIKVLTSENRFVRLAKRLFYPGLINISECPFQQARELAAKGTAIYLNGYFQDENFFLQIRRALLAELSFPDPGSVAPASLAQILSADNAVSIHVRRGDYLTPKALAFHGVLGPDYYQASVQLMNSRVPTPHYFIFSDDPDWCREHLDFPGDKSIMPPGEKAWVDLALMSKCRHNIIANSSFSWWAAWLNNNPEKIVIAPRKWFADEEANSGQHTIIPDNWISI